ncbi:MAG: putative sulfate/molybdate transporter [Candidatus Bathyarchaeota archaeon]|nr:MAG: putative sulfate/molybdate transporter [Candidatus Bathyarchaeota archaeon]
MVKLFTFDITLRELAGAFGDFGTLMPFTIGYIAVTGFKPTGLLLGIGLTNIFLAFIYKIPLPVQPKKVIGAVALANNWSVGQVLGAGFTTGLIELILAVSKIGSIFEKVPKSVIRGIQLGLAFNLALTGAEMIKENVLFAVPILAIALLLLRNRYLPSAIFLMLFGFGFSLFSGSLLFSELIIGFSLPTLHVFSLEDMFFGFAYGGFAQLFLTMTNAVIATVALVHDLFPDRKDISAQNLLTNMGVMNVILPFIGGMPLCHGSGGLAAQYLFGARTGGAIMMEGILEILLAVVFSDSLFAIFSAFPMFVVGAMLLLTAVELGKISMDLTTRKGIFVMIFTAIVSTAFNIAAGFIVGVFLYLALKKNIIQAP